MKKTIFKILMVLVIFILPQCSLFKRNVYLEVPEGQFSVRAPVIRVGLIDLPPQIEIKAEKGLKVIGRQNSNFQRSMAGSKVKIELRREKREVYYVQIGAFLKKENAENYVNQLSSIYKFPLKIFQTSQFYQVRIGPFQNYPDAMELLKYSIKNGVKDAWIVSDFASNNDQNDSIFLDDKELEFNGGADIFIIPFHQFDFIKINGNPYRGIIEVKNNERGITIINILNIEDYLKGVVPLEMNPEQFKEIEALKAQAVSARTFAMRRLLSHEEKDYDICSTVKCQVYKGAFFEHPLSNRAVEETEGEIMVWNNEPINALYMGSCGGYTEDIENVFGGESIPYLRGTFCFHKNGVSSLEWREEKSREEILKILKRQFPVEDIVDIYPLRRGVSGRIVELRVLTSKDFFDIRGFLIKEIFGLKDLPLEILKSANQDNEGEKYVFEGRGRGHGVGLCQEGAYSMAKMKKNYKEILLHYYKNVDIVNWKEKGNEFRGTN